MTHADFAPPSAEERIRRTLARFCHLTDSGDFDAWVTLFAEDGCFVLMDQVHRGHVALRAFIEDDQPRPQRQRTGNVHALALAAGQFVRIAFGIVGGVQPDLVEKVAHAGAGLCSRQAVRLGREGQRLGDGEPGVERSVGVLEHHLHLAAQFVDRDPVRLVDGVAVEHHGPAVGGDEPDQEAGNRRLAAARLSHDAQRLALGDGQGKVVDGPHHLAGPAEQPARNGKVLAQAGRQQKGLGGTAAVDGRQQRIHVRPSHPWRRADRRSSG